MGEPKGQHKRVHERVQMRNNRKRPTIPMLADMSDGSPKKYWFQMVGLVNPPLCGPASSNLTTSSAMLHFVYRLILLRCSEDGLSGMDMMAYTWRTRSISIGWVRGLVLVERRRVSPSSGGDRPLSSPCTWKPIFLLYLGQVCCAPNGPHL